MKFKNYLKDIDFQIELIKKECQPFLKLLKSNKIYTPLYRGMINANYIGIKKVHKNRTPKLTNKSAFELVNKMLKEKGHIPRNNCIIGTFDIDEIGKFGPSYFVFPKGNIKYSYCKEKDFNYIGYLKGTMEEDYYFNEYLTHGFVQKNDDDNWNWDIDYKDMEKFDNEYINKLVSDTLDKYITSNRAIKYAEEKGFEIWFQCKEYYYISTDIIPEKELMGKLL